jgi:hypothetical protein
VVRIIKKVIPMLKKAKSADRHSLVPKSGLSLVD